MNTRVRQILGTAAAFIISYGCYGFLAASHNNHVAAAVVLLTLSALYILEATNEYR